MASGARIEERKLEGIPNLPGKVWHTNKHTLKPVEREREKGRDTQEDHDSCNVLYT